PTPPTSHPSSRPTSTIPMNGVPSSSRPADGRLVPGDQLVKINNVAAEDLTPEQAAEIIRECQDIVTMTVLRTMGPKSSFITPEKRAKLRSNPVKVHFAEEVEVNGNSQGNTLLFLPNVLKVYLENGQTKAFKFEPNTTVKDIVMTLKEKLSLCRIEPFCLVLEQQHSVTKLLLLHEEERIQQVVQKKESHDYRCLFRVCYMPKDPRDLLLEDPTAFEYLYFQGVNDVLQERFAVEMRCNTALRLAALHIQERLASCGQSPKTTLKTITKTWGIENFVSSTLLRNMREKDLRKAVGYHMKKSQSQQDPKQKGLSFNQARINYLEELSELKSFMGKSFSATMLLQDRESTVSLLVGARYGVSQVVNHKLSIMTTLTEFSSISRIELLPESERISLVKIYLQDIKPITLLLESVAAKDMSCLIAGYCKVFANPDIQVFPWPEKPKKHRVSAEEGYVSRRASDSDSSSDMDADPLIHLVSHDNKPRPRIRSSSDPERPKRKERERPRPPGEAAAGGDDFWGADETFSEASDSCRTDSRFLTSPSSDSLDALEEDDLVSCSSSSFVRAPSGLLHLQGTSFSPRPSQKLRPYKHTLPHPHLLSDARCYYKLCSSVTPDSALSPPRPGPGPGPGSDGERDAKKGGSGGEGGPEETEPVHILQPPPGFGDSSSEEEFFDAWDRFSSPEEPSAGGVPGGNPLPFGRSQNALQSIDEIEGGQRRAGMGMVAEDGGGVETLVQLRRRSRKRRSFMETTFTSMVTFPEPDADSNPNLNSNRTQRGLPSQDGDTSRLSGDPEAPEQTQNICPTVASMTHAEGEPALLESKPIPSKELLTASRRKKQEMEMEPDAMESKSVTDLVKTSPPSITVVRCRVEPDGKESADRIGDGKEEGEEEEEEEGKVEEEAERKVEREEDGEEEELMKTPQNGPVFIHYRQLSEIIEESCKCEEVGDEWYEKEWGIVRESVSGAETLKEEEDSSQSDNVFADDFLTQLPPPPSFAQPLPPNCFSPPLPVVDNPSQNPQLSSSQQVGLNDTQVYVSELPKLKFLNREQYVMVNTVTKNDGTSSISNSDTTSDDVIDVVESDNVFVVEDEEDDEDNDDSEEDDVEEDDDDNSVPLSLCYTRENSQNNHNVDHDAAMKAAVASSLPSPDSQTKGHSSSNPLTPITSSEYENTINSITAKLGVATAALSPLLTAGGTIHHETTRDKASGSNHDTDTVRIGSTMPDAESASKVSLGMASVAAIKHSFDAPCDGLAQANTTTVHHLSKEPPSPTHFLFQTCSPSIMGRLSASTLREKIQMLPLYLSRSQETLPQTGSDSASPSPCKVVSNNSQDRSEVAIQITDVDNVTQAMDFGTSPRRGSIESDDSDVTLTGSEVETEVDGELGSPLVPETTSPTASNERKTAESVAVSNANSAIPVQSEPRTTRHMSCEPCSDTPGPIVKPPTSLAVPSDTEARTPGPVKEAPESSMKSASNIPGFIMNSQQSSATPHPMVVTTQTHNGPGLSFYSPTEKVRTSTDRPLTGLCRPAAEATGAPKSHSSGCEMFTICSAQSQTKDSVSVPAMKPDYSCSSVLSSGCESAVEGLQTPLEACGCTAVYTNCFSSGDNFDDELTVYEFSCRSQGSSRAGSTSEVGLPLITAAGPVSSFLSKSPPSFSASTLSPSFPRSSIVFSSATSELSPLLSPLSDSQDSVSSQSHKETISSIRQHCYPANPAGFQPLRSDVDQLISILEGGGGQGGQGGHGGRHARETCPAHFTENKHVLHTEARRLMAGCQKAAALGQNPEETLVALADSFRHLVELAGACLWFSGCDRCDRRNGEAVAGLADVARSFRDFCLAAERACSKRSCQDLSAKLLAKQCTALTASVFCLTQLFRTLTAL
uniref:FERM and PDZ domain containing 1 n=1 Tax=Gadus morhua TaxID=8049 RepID=A0A8C5AWQ7_GADMO